MSCFHESRLALLQAVYPLRRKGFLDLAVEIPVEKTNGGYNID